MQSEGGAISGFVYILIFLILDSKEDDNIFWTEWWQLLRLQPPLNFFMNAVWWKEMTATYNFHIMSLIKCFHICKWRSFKQYKNKTFYKT